MNENEIKRSNKSIQFSYKNVAFKRLFYIKQEVEFIMNKAQELSNYDFHIRVRLEYKGRFLMFPTKDVSYMIGNTLKDRIGM